MTVCVGRSGISGLAIRSRAGPANARRKSITVPDLVPDPDSQKQHIIDPSNPLRSCPEADRHRPPPGNPGTCSLDFTVLDNDKRDTNRDNNRDTRSRGRFEVA